VGLRGTEGDEDLVVRPQRKLQGAAWPARTCLCLVLCTTRLSLLAVEERTTPYRDFGKLGAGFNGPGRDATAPLPADGVRVGFTCPERTLEGKEFRAAVNLAIEERNKAGGFKGVPFVPVFRFDDGPWGMVSKQVVALAYEDEVWAIVGGLDGGRAHVAELIAAKAWIPVVNTAASDATIDYANVPWVFRIMPSDSAQARALLSHARERELKDIALLVEDDRDSRSAMKRIEEESRHEKKPLRLVIEYRAADVTSAVRRLKDSGMDGVLLWGRHDGALGILKAIRADGIRIPVLAPASLAAPDVAADGDGLGDLTVTAPYDPGSMEPKREDFERRFEAACGNKPSPVAAAAYDATRLALDAIEKADLNRVRIRDVISSEEFSGLCGKFRFSELGGNPSEPVLLHIEGRRWVRVERPTSNKR